jgi:serine/threonine protein kinase
MTLTVQEFWQSVVASGLHDEENCRRLADAYAAARESGTIPKTTSLPEWMLNTGAMTRYQARLLLGGKPGSFLHGEFLVLEPLATPGTSDLYRAVHRPTTIPVCLKIIDPATPIDTRFATTLAEESGLAAAAARRTPYLTHCHGLIDADGVRFFVIEELPPMTLARRLTRDARLDAKDAALLLWQAAQGLACLHEVGLVHGAIRPDRIWLTPSGSARLSAFPLARDPLARLAINAALALDPAAIEYAAPECTDPDAATAASDIYSLGCTAYRTVTGRVPNPGGFARRDQGSRSGRASPEPDELNATAPQELAALVMSMLASKPDERPATANEVAAALAPLVRRYGAAADAAAVPESRLKLENWLVEHGQLTGPAAGPMAGLPFSVATEPARSSYRARKGRSPFKRKQLPLVIAGVSAIAAAGIAGTLFLLSGPRQQLDMAGSGVPVAARPSAAAEATAIAANTAVAANDPRAETSEPLGAAGPEAGHDSPAAESIVGLDATIWASPTHGRPLDLKYLAPGAEVIVALRPAELMRNAETEKLLDARTTGALGEFVAKDIVALVGTPLDRIERLLVGVVDSPDGAPRLAIVATLADPVAEEEVVKSFGNYEVHERDGVKFHQAGERALYIPAAESGRTIVIGPANLVADEVIPAAGAPPVLRREMEVLLAATDADRDLTILAAPTVLFTGGQEWLPGNTGRLRSALDWFLSGAEPDARSPQPRAESPAGRSAEARSADLSTHGLPKAIMASLHLTETDMFAELRVYAEPSRPVQVLASEYRERLSRLPKRVSEYVGGLALGDYSHDVLWNFPLMVEQLGRYTVVGTDGRQVVLRACLPSIAAHNLALGTNLAINERPRSAGSGGTTPAQARPAVVEPLAKRLERSMSLVFDRATLEKALQMVGDEVGAPVVIEGRDLQTEGITKNQSFSLEERDQPARLILRKIMRRANPDGKLVYVIKPSQEGHGDTLYVTTRAAAGKRGDTLPAEFVEPP